jgi:hypothetical protein
VQQIADTFQCFDGSLNAYLDKFLEIIALFDNFTMQHVSRDENTVMKSRKIQFSRKTGYSGIPNRTVWFLIDVQCDNLFCWTKSNKTEWFDF